jgi:hypothetical protein
MLFCIINIWVFVHLTDSHLQQLYRATTNRLQHAFRPGTKVNQQVQVRRFYTFCRRFNFPHLNPSATQLALYVEYLAQNLRSAQSVRNYLSAVSHIHRQLGLDCTAIQSAQVTNMLRAVNITLRSTILPTLPVTISMLHRLILLCDQLGTWGLVCKCAFLFCFFGFFRQSNVAPRSPHAFDNTRDTCREDVESTPTGLRIRLKWTKTIQGAHHPIWIPLPSIKGSPLCPVKAFRLMCTVLPASAPHTPLLICTTHTNRCKVVTTRLLARQFKTLITQLRLNPKTYTLHSLRKGGASLAHSMGVPLEHIKSHGTWSSSAVWTYLKPSSSQRSSVTQAMARAAISNPHL